MTLGYDQDPVAFWTPAIGQAFGIRPWEMLDVRVDQYRAMAAALVEMQASG